MNSAKSPNVTSNFPKYYLADVPQELRRRVLDLCTKRLWQDARDLLSQHGFTDYTFADLQSFYDWAPTELPQVGRGLPIASLPESLPPVAANVSSRLTAGIPAEPLSTSLPLVGRDCVEPCSADRSYGVAQPQHARSTTEHESLAPPQDPVEPSSPERLITDDRSLNASPPSTVEHPRSSIQDPASSIEHPASSSDVPAPLPPSPSVLKSRRSSREPRRRRSKITRLPKEIRDELNSRLENGATYASVIEWLASKGHSGFNETNMSWWKNGGYQDWLRDEQRKQESRALRDWSAAIADKKDPTVLANALSNFSGAKLHLLLCDLDYEAMARELQARPEVCIRYFNSAIRTGRVSLEAARVDHLVHTKNDKRAPTMAEIEDIERRLNLL